MEEGDGNICRIGGDSTATFTSSELWEPTMNLRFKGVQVDINEFTCKTINQLQQLWCSNKGNQEWRPVEMVY